MIHRLLNDFVKMMFGIDGSVGVKINGNSSTFPSCFLELFKAELQISLLVLETFTEPQ